MCSYSIALSTSAPSLTIVQLNYNYSFIIYLIANKESFHFNILFLPNPNPKQDFSITVRKEHLNPKDYFNTILNTKGNKCCNSEWLFFILRKSISEAKELWCS